MGNVDEPDKDADNSNDLGQSVTEVVEFLLERGGLRDLGGDVFVDVANRSVGTGQNDDGRSVSSNNSSTREEHVDLVLLYGVRILDGICVLANTLTLSGQDALVDAEAVAVDGQDSAVGRNAVTHGHLDDVSRNQFVCLDALNLAIAYDLGLVGRVLLECCDCLFGGRFLRYSDDGVENEDSENLGGTGQKRIQSRRAQCRTYYDGVDKDGPVVAILEQGEDERYGGRGKQDDDQLVLELFQDEFP